MLAVMDHSEVVIEGGDLVDFGGCQLEFAGKRPQMVLCKMSGPVLKTVEEFDQQIAPPWRVAEQFGNQA